MNGDSEARFEVIDELGRGRHAVVLRVRDCERAGVELAWKIANDAPDARAALKRETDVLRVLQERGVRRAVTLWDVFGTDGELPRSCTLSLAGGSDFVAFVRAGTEAPVTSSPTTLPMAFGQTVQPLGASRFACAGAMGITRLRAALEALESAVASIHDAGFVHGDLQAANVRVTDEGELTLIDFGLARRIGEVIGRDELIGEADVIAPELGEGGTATCAADWYAVGVLLFRALTGDTPFAGTGRDVFVRKMTVDAPRASLLVRDVPDDLDCLCARLLAIDPASRRMLDAP